MKDARWRRKAERYAKRHGYFWLPCSVCGAMFGGQEWGGAVRVDETVDGGYERGSGICAHCAGTRLSAAERRLRALGEVAEVHATNAEGNFVRHRVGASS